MKKILAAVSILALLVGLAGCGAPANEYGLTAYTQFYDTKTERIYSIGDAQTVFDEAFGEPEINEDGESVYEGGLRIRFNITDNCALQIRIYTPIEPGRFKFYLFDESMSMDELSKTYEVDDSGEYGSVYYQQSFDENNKPVDPRSGTQVVTISILQSTEDSITEGPKGTFTMYNMSGIMSEEERQAQFGDIFSDSQSTSE